MFTLGIRSVIPINSEERSVVRLVRVETVGDFGQILLGDFLEIQALLFGNVREVPKNVADLLGYLVGERTVPVPFSHPLLILREEYSRNVRKGAKAASEAPYKSVD